MSVNGDGMITINDEQTVTPSEEEADALARSRKKVRIGEGVDMVGRPVVPRVEEWMNEDEPGNMPEAPKKFYRDAYLKERPMDDVEEEEDDWWSGDGWMDRVQVVRTDAIPDIVSILNFGTS